MITITRRLAGTLKIVFRAALSLSTRGPHPSVLIEAGDDGYRIRCRTADATAEYCTTDKSLPERMIVPFELLSRCAANNDQPLTLEQSNEGILAHWQEGPVPQLHRFDALELLDETWPEQPEHQSENPPQLLAALRDACRFTDSDSSRYALGCLQLSGEGKITATNGKALLIQTGFDFPWKGELLLPASKLFSCKQLSQQEPVIIGQAEEWVSMKTGRWTFQRQLFKDGRFPHVDDLVRSADQASASFEIPPEDRSFLRENLSRLPGSEEYNAPVTLDLNGKIVVRSKAPDAEAVTELVLNRASRSGEPIRFNTNRNLFAHALQLGFDRVHLTGANSPAFCLDESRFFLWALLEPESAIKPISDAILIESNSTENVNQSQPSHSSRRPTMKSSQSSRSQKQSRTDKPVCGQSPTTSPNTPAPSKHSELSTIEQAIALRDSLRSISGEVGELVKTLKRERKQHRAVRSTLLSLQQLQAIDA